MVMRGMSRRLNLCAVVVLLAGVAGASGTMRAGRGGAALAAALVVGAGAARAEGGGAAMAAWTAVIVGAAGVGADQYCGAGSYWADYWYWRSSASFYAQGYDPLYRRYPTCERCPAVSLMSRHIFVICTQGCAPP